MGCDGLLSNIFWLLIIQVIGVNVQWKQTLCVYYVRFFMKKWPEKKKLCKTYLQWQIESGTTGMQFVYRSQKTHPPLQA